MSKASIPFAGPRGIAALKMLDRMRHNPLPVCDELHATYGDRVGLKVSGYRYVLLLDPDDIEAVLVKGQHQTHKGEALKQARKMMGNQLLVVEDEQHAAQRKVLAPAFVPNRLAPYAPIFANCTKVATDRWSEGQHIDAEPEMNRLDLEISGRTIFGDSVDHETAELGEALAVAVELFPLALHPMRPLIEKLPWGPMHKIEKSRARLNETIERLIQEGRDRAARGGDRGDILRILMDAYDGPDARPGDDVILVDEARGMLMGGHETAANTLAWGLHLLAGDRAIQDAIAEEVHRVCGDEPVTAETAEQLPITRGAIQEALRLYPAGGLHIRATTGEVTLPDGVVLEPDTQIIISGWTLHRDARYWKNPLQFDPGRWINPDPDRPRYAYIPWGGGKRVCIGAAYATLLGTVLFAEMMRRVYFEVAPESNPVAISVFTVRPKYGLPLIVHRR